MLPQRWPFALLLVGCSPNLQVQGAPDVQCTRDTECPAQQRCFAELERCVLISQGDTQGPAIRSVVVEPAIVRPGSALTVMVNFDEPLLVAPELAVDGHTPSVGELSEAEPTTYLFTVPAGAEGTYVMRWTAVDQFGNVSMPTSGTFIVDGTPPPITEAIWSTAGPVPRSATTQLTATFPDSDTDVVSVELYHADDDALIGPVAHTVVAGPPLGPAFLLSADLPWDTFGFAEDTEVYAQIRVRDTAGNETPPTGGRTASLRIDLGPPDTVFTLTPPSDNNDLRPRFTLESPGADASVFECSLNDGPFEPCPPTSVLSLSEAGSYTLRARSRDDAGQLDPTPAEFSWTETRRWMSGLQSPYCHIASDRSLWCWGDGSVGDGTRYQFYSVPQQVGTHQDWVWVRDFEDLRCGIREDGGTNSLWCWGDQGPTVYLPQPEYQTEGYASVWRVESFGETWCGLTAAGRVDCWGIMIGGGFGAPVLEQPTLAGEGFTRFELANDIDDVVACGLKGDQSLWCWGTLVQVLGELGDVPQQMGAFTDWVDFSVSPGFNGSGVCGIREVGAQRTLWCYDAFTELLEQVGSDTDWVDFDGRGGLRGSAGAIEFLYFTDMSDPPFTLLPASNWTHLESPLCARRATGPLDCIGDPVEWLLGDPTGQLFSLSAGPSAEISIARLDAGQSLFRQPESPYCVLGPDGRLACDLGLVDRASPPTDVVTPLSGGPLFTILTSGGDCSVVDDGRALCGEGLAERAAVEVSRFWVDYDDDGPFRPACGIERVMTEDQLVCEGGISGDGIYTVLRPGDSWTDIDIDARDRCAIRDDATLWCWGDSNDGILGNGTNDESDVPVQVGVGVAETGWMDVAVSFGSACGTREVTPGQGSLWCWGRNTEGQLGLGDTTNRNWPTQLGTDTDWTWVRFENGSAFVGKADGSLWAFGLNDRGKLGLGDFEDATTPQLVNDTLNWLDGSLSPEHACALTVDGRLFCAGRDQVGEAGFSSPGLSAVMLEASFGTGAMAVACSQQRTCFLRADTYQCVGNQPTAEVFDLAGPEQ